MKKEAIEGMENSTPGLPAMQEAEGRFSDNSEGC
jgi:hypothetical protein